MTPSKSTTVHATTVAIDGKGVLILGRAGAGKSSLALQLIALGAVLVADDRTQLRAMPDGLVAEGPDTIAGMIEARGVGILKLPGFGPVPLHLAIDLDRTETARLPEPHQYSVLDHNLPCLHRADGPHFPIAVMFFVRAESGPIYDPSAL